MADSLWQPLLNLVAAASIVMGSPGPSTMSITAAAAAYGPRRSLNYMLGLIAGTIAVLLLVACGVGAALVSLPFLATAFTVASAGYMFYLAWRIATAPPLRKLSPDSVAPSFSGGFLLAIANPKAYVAIAAVFAGTTLVAGSAIVDAILKAAFSV